MTAPEVILDTSLAGTPISIHHSDGHLIAHGILSQKPPAGQWLGVNVTITCMQVTVQQTLVPGAILPLHNKSLVAFGPTPFDICWQKTYISVASVSIDKDIFQSPIW